MLFGVLLVTRVRPCIQAVLWGKITAMTQEPVRISHLKQKWSDEDALRDERERRAKQLFLEEQADQMFAPIKDYLARLDKVLRITGGSVKIDERWEHLGDQRLRRVAKVTSTASRQQLPIDLIFQGASIFYRD